jgi:hypothetical protein
MSGALVLMALAVCWSQKATRFTTPAACLDAYREACRAGDVDKYKSCLAEPLRSAMQRQYPNPKELARHLSSEMKDVKTWVQLLDSVSDDTTAQINVDEVRQDGSRRIRFRLRRTGGDWLIAGTEQPKLVPTGIPYGTHVSKVPESPESAQP